MMKNMLPGIFKIFFVLLFASLCSNVYSQLNLFYDDIYRFSQVATRSLKAPVDSTIKKNSVCILPASVEWRFYPDYTSDRSYYRKQDSLYLKPHKSGDIVYTTVPNLESVYRNKITSGLRESFAASGINVMENKFDKKDSILFAHEISNIKAYLNGSSLKNFVLSDSLCFILFKLGASQVIYYDMLVCHGDIPRMGGAWDTHLYQRLFVFNPLNKSITYYKFKKNINGGLATEYWLPLLHDRGPQSFLYDDYPKIKSMLKPYIRFLKRRT